MGDVGFEHPPLAGSQSPISGNQRTESGTVDGEKALVDPDLEFIIDGWPKLPEHIKTTVMTLVRAAADDKSK